MRLQFDNKVLSTFSLLIDHEIQNKGVAYTNYSGRFFPTPSNRAGLYAYAAPFKQLCNDTSISGANVISGVYVNGNYVNIGQSGLYSINHYQGVAYFTGQFSSATTVSGRYAVKDVNVELTDHLESKLLFETKHSKRPGFNTPITGLPIDTRTLPALYLKVKDTDAAPAAFGGIKDNKIKIRGTLMAENEFQRLAVCNILKNLTHTGFGVVDNTPFDYLGNYTGASYSFPNLNFRTDVNSLITEVKASEISWREADDMENLGNSYATIDFTITTFMNPA
jgi:hypothetical protein